MKTTYWIAGILVVGLGAGVVGMANAHQKGSQFGPQHGLGRISFEQLDTNADGQLTKAEMQAQKAAQFAKTDSNGDGMLSADEMQARSKERLGMRMSRRIGKRVGKMIERHDANGDGMLSLSEMQDMPRGKGLFQRLDADGDGAISAQEFAARKAARWGHKSGRPAME